MSTPPRYLTVTQTAERLHYSPRHIRRLLKSGELRGFTPGAGRRVLILESEVEAYLRPLWIVDAEERQQDEEGAA